MAERRTIENMDQVFLTDFMSEIEKLRTNLPRRNKFISQPAKGQGEFIINETVRNESFNFIQGKAAPFLESILQPRIRLYKVFFENELDKTGISIPLNFEFMGKPNLVDEKGSREWATGLRDSGDANPYLTNQTGYLATSLRDFTIDFDGVNPAEVDYYIKCSMTLAFDSPAALFHKHPAGNLNGKQVYTNFANLIERPTKYQKGFSVPGTVSGDIGEKSHQVFNQDYFRIRVEIYYDELTDDKFELAGLNHLNDSERQDLKNAVKSCNMSFYLNLLKHEFRWDFPDGNSDQSKTYFELKIDYVGAVEGALQDTNSNILTTGLSDKMKQFQEEEIYKRYHELKNFVASTDLAAFNVADPNAKVEARAIGSLTPEKYGEIMRERTRAGTEVALANPAALAQDAIFDALGGAEISTGSPLLKQINDQRQGWAAAGVQWNVENALLLQKFIDVRNEYNARAASLGVAESQQLSVAYNRIYDMLWGRNIAFKADYAAATKDGSLRRQISSQRANVKHVWEFAIYANKFNEYLNRSEARKPTDFERKASQNAAKNKDFAAIERLKKQRESAQNNIRNFYNNFWKEALINREGAVRVDAARRNIRTRTTDAAGQVLDGYYFDAETGATVTSSETDRDVRTSAATAQATGDKEAVTRVLEALTPKQVAPPNRGDLAHLIQFFFLGDLVDIAIELANENSNKSKLDFHSHTENKFGRLHFILGDVRYNDFLTGKIEKINLDAIPISTKLFDEFWVKHVIKRQRKNYPLKQFLRDVIVDLIQAAFTNKNRAPGEPTNKITCAMDHVTIDPNKNGIFAKLEKGAQWGAKNPVSLPNRVTFTKAGGKPTEAGAAGRNVKDLCILHAYSNKPTHFKGNRRDDHQRGIPHINIGIAPTSITRVDFKKTDQPMYLEAKGEVDGIKDNSLELSEPYSVGLTMPGNFIFRPGSHFRLTMEGFGSPQTRRGSRGASHFGAPPKTVLATSPARRLGLGGYFMVNKCSHTLSARMGDYQTGFEWTTELDALWVTFGGIAERRSTPVSDITKSSNPALNEIRSSLKEAGITADGAFDVESEAGQKLFEELGAGRQRNEFKDESHIKELLAEQAAGDPLLKPAEAEEE